MTKEMRERMASLKQAMVWAKTILTDASRRAGAPESVDCHLVKAISVLTNAQMALADEMWE